MTDSAGLSEEHAARLARLSERRGASSSTKEPRSDLASSTPSPAPSSTPSPSRRSKKRRRRHPAQGSRIAAAGLGATTMFSIVTLLGSNNPFASASTPEAVAPADTTAPLPTPAAPPVQVVVHWIPATVPSATATSLEDPGALVPAATEVVEQSTGPVVLTATPVVRTVTVQTPAAPPRAPSSPAPATASSPAPAPAATTSGSS